MKNKNTEKIIHDIKKIVLTPKEKATLFAKLDHYANTHQPIQSPFGIFVWPYRYVSKPLVYVLASVLVIVLVGGTTVSASEKALPGDLLYPIKIHVTEPLHVAFARTPEARERVQVAHVEERFTEAETLAIQGRLTTVAVGEIKGILGREVASLKDTLSPENQDDLDIQMAVHSVVLKSIRGYADEHQKANIDDVESVTHASIDASTENPEENTNEEVKVEKPNTEKRTEKKNNNNDESFSQRQTNVEQVIEDTNKKIEQNMTNNNSFERDILNDASSSLHTAKDSLKDAVDRQAKNKKDEASVFIGDSERNAKKAAVSVDRGLELGKIKRGNR